LVEQRFCKPKVAGSIPAAGTASVTSLERLPSAGLNTYRLFWHEALPFRPARAASVGLPGTVAAEVMGLFTNVFGGLNLGWLPFQGLAYRATLIL
jgi:hypothetical protein